MNHLKTMAVQSSPPSLAAWAAVTAALAVGAIAAGCNVPDDHHPPPRTIGPSVIEIRLPEQVGDWKEALRRPAVEFDHGQHEEALKQEGCQTCHPVDQARSTDDEQVYVFDLQADQDPKDRDGLMDRYHEMCVGCHRERAAADKSAGATSCGECHAERTASASQRQAVTFDSSLHYRHAKARGHECGDCHHVKDDKTGKLVYRAQAEESCRACHGSAEHDGTPSLRQASHQDCVNCHLGQQGEGQPKPPVQCVGCHDATAQAAIAQLTELPRLDVGQPDQIWLQAPGAKSNLVPFDHRAHESLTTNCSSCHHERLWACSECHTLTGDAAGQHVTLEDAYHRASSTKSCVGCHQARTAAKDCAGCHSTMPSPPAEASCIRCHSGPPVAAGAASDSAKLPAVEMAGLPESGDDFPDSVVIGELAEHFGPSTLPHRQIVEYLQRAAAKSPLANRFHGTPETLCAGCHHQSPLGTRPPPCRSCHETKAGPTRDMPSLKGAYHRQCIGCHVQMDIEPVGCTKGCHEPADNAAKPPKAGSKAKPAKEGQR